MSEKTKDDAQELREYHREVGSIEANLKAFFEKTFSEVHFDGPDIDPAEIQKSPMMFVSTHRSHVDYFAIGSNFFGMGFKNIRYAAGDNLTKLPWIGQKFVSFGAFSVARDKGFERNYVRNLCAQVIKMMGEGDAVLVFPEGGRSYTGAMLEIKGGILNAALMMQAADPGKDVYLMPAAISYECPPDLPYFPLLLTGKKYRKKPTNFFKRTLGDIYYFGADIMAFAPFMTARRFRRNYGGIYMDYGDPISVKSLVDLEANRVQNARDEFAAHKRSLDIVGEKLHKILSSLFRILPIHIISAASVTLDPLNKTTASVTLDQLEKNSAHIKALVEKEGCNCKTIGSMTPKQIVDAGLKSLSKLKAIKVNKDKVIITKKHIIDYFAAAVPKGDKSL